MSHKATMATRLITKHGESVILKSKTFGAYDPALGAKSETIAETTCVGMPVQFKPGDSNITGTLIQSGDISMMLSSGDVTPRVKGTITFDGNGKEYQVIAVYEHRHKGVVAYYDLHLRAS
ncbi:MAG: hypothetical protein H8E42_05120 [Nitrospinae bacterium]|nr:hypothetical protein [Nitrospinota bacterium]